MSNRTPKEALREIRNRIVYMYGNIDGTFNPPALKEVCEIADDAISSPITEKSSAVGNAAAMRKALINIQEYAKALDAGDLNVLAILYTCRAALSAPARNCDRYKDAPSAYADFIVPWKLDGHLDEVPTLQDFANWLFAPAAEQKGEGDGR